MRFCIDRGSDCLGQKIRTGFIVIEANFEIMGLYSSNPQTYFKPDQKKWRIGSNDMSSLLMAKIREHILESYCIKIKEMGLDSIICNRKDSISMELESSDAEIPTREDVERLLRSLHGEADEDVFKAAVVANFTKERRMLKADWWEITKKNMIEWSKKG